MAIRLSDSLFNLSVLMISPLLMCVGDGLMWVLELLRREDHDQPNHTYILHDHIEQSSSTGTTTTIVHAVIDGIRDDDDDVCAICMCEYEDGDRVRKMPECGHIFHQRCIDKWLSERSRTCPLCRRTFVLQQTKHFYLY